MPRKTTAEKETWMKERKEFMKKIISMMLIAALSVASLTGCGQTKTENTEETKKETEVEQETDTQLLSGKHNVELVIKDYGTIEMELDADKAPITVTNFVNLVDEGFYDGLTFHRIIEGFMMQGGDPNGDGTGGAEKTIKGEFSSNGVDNDLSHTRGAVSMARSSDPDSASSQFFIVHQDSEFLDDNYAVFGYVTDGMDVVDQICENVKPTDSNGTIPADQQPVIEKMVNK